ncbi:MFS general substrate transporter [Pseudohyphozyma bogoriensis]|nr:MFS general substrate transporter [Pseudohyphozyma bogoriensis]
MPNCIMSLDSSSDIEKRPTDVGVAQPVDGLVDVEARKNLTYKEGQRILRKIDLNVMPLLILAYLIKNIDSNAISYVKSMNPNTPTNIAIQLGMSTNAYAWTSTIFTIPFWATPRWHFVRILTLWSIAAICQAAAKNAAGLLTARFFIGLFEGGLYPGIFLMLTSWYRPDEIGVRFACISVLGQFSGIFNSLIAYGLSYISGRHGVSGWQYLFIIEGALGFLCAILMVFFLPNYPDTAKFLSQEERDWVQARLPPNAARASDETFSWKEAKMAVTDPATIGFTLMCLLINSAAYPLQFWLPSIITAFGFTGAAQSQLLNIPPAVVYLAAGIAGGYLSDHSVRLSRPLIVIINCVLAIGLFAGLAFCRSNAGLYALICLASIPPAWVIKGSTHAAVSLAFQNGIGGMAGFYTAQIFRSQYAPRYTTPFIITLVFWALVIPATAWMWMHTKDTESDSRRVAALRREAGKKHNEVITDEIAVDEKVIKRAY